jgi:hypothetical protein
MKSYTIFVVLVIFFFGAATAQKVITLSVNQPPELGFSLNQQDTTILLGTTITLGNGIVVYGGSGDYLFQWSPTETLNDPTLMRPLATPKDTTTYNLMVTDKFGCSFSVNYTVNTRGPLVGTAVVATNKNLEAILFPNPNDGKFKIRITGEPVENIDLVIFDNNGRMINRQVISHFSGLHTEILQMILPPGSYTLRIDNGNSLLSRQFIIQ